MNKKVIRKCKHDICISDETREDKIVIKGNNLNFRWAADKCVLVWSENEGEPGFVELLGRMEDERSRMASLLFKKGVKTW